MVSINRYHPSCLLFVFVLSGFFNTFPCWAFEPEEVLVVANRHASGSVGLAKYYMKKRGIPDKNLVKVRVTDQEKCSRKDYENKVAAPVRAYIDKILSERKIRCLVIMYGLPLKVKSPEITSVEKNRSDQLKERKFDLEEQIKNLKEESQERLAHLDKELNSVLNEMKYIRMMDASASLDSEIALVRQKDYPLSGWIINPFFIGHKEKNVFIEKHNVLMVSRLDGPSEEIVKRIIDDSLSAEKHGLKGTAYFDARWPLPSDKKVQGYAFYDMSIHLAADRVNKSGILNAVIEETEDLFKPGQCPNTALYCGWYSLAQYVDAFSWQPGSIGYHIASSECNSLKRKNSRIWCLKMLENGIAATIGPVSEPYVQAFPVPEVFFGFLIDGYLSLAECYLVSIPYLSWKMVLVGDPLYRPFKLRDS